MKTILYIGNSVCLRLDELRNYFLQSTSSPDLYEELLTLYLDGTLLEWLKEGNDKELELASLLESFPRTLSNHEMMSRLIFLFTDTAHGCPMPDAKDYLEVYSVVYQFQGNEKEYSLRKEIVVLTADMAVVSFIIRFKVINTDNETLWLRLTDNEDNLQLTGIHLRELSKGQLCEQCMSCEISDTKLHSFSLYCNNELMAEAKFQLYKPVSLEEDCLIIRPNMECGIAYKLIRVDGAAFNMGNDTKTDPDARTDEYPAHKVHLDTFFIGETLVTQELWQEVMGCNPSYFKGKRLPVESVSWNECQLFILKMRKMTGLKLRLPTEAEWEYAARGGNRSQGFRFAGSNIIDEVAWYDKNSGNTTHDVGMKCPNEIGMYDMSGNVWEWCQDWYSDNTYVAGSVKNPTGKMKGISRVIRGGGWSNTMRGCRSTNRSSCNPATAYNFIGLRLALNLTEKVRKEMFVTK